MDTTDTATPLSLAAFGWRCVMAGVGATMGLCIGGTIWLVNQFTGQHHEVLVNTLVLTLVLGGIGFFVSPRKPAWMDALLYFLLLGFLDG